MMSEEKAKEDMLLWMDVKPEGETPITSAHRTSTCLDRDINQYARLIRGLSEYPVRYIATKEAR